MRFMPLLSCELLRVVLILRPCVLRVLRMKTSRWLVPALFTLPALGLVARANSTRIAADQVALAPVTHVSPSSNPSLATSTSSGLPVDRAWVKVRGAATLASLSEVLKVSSAKLALINDVDEDHAFSRGDWLVIPAKSLRLVRQSAALDSSQARRSLPLFEPPAPDLPLGPRPANASSPLLRAVQSIGPVVNEVLRQSPGDETARVLSGQGGQPALAAGIRQQILIAARPTTSGGLSWPDTPDFGPETPSEQNDRAWIWPAAGQFSSGFGWRWGRMHNGIDIANAVGTKIVAARSGRVVFAGWDDGGYGYKIDIRHNDGSLSRYAHNSRLLVQVGDDVAQGVPISLMGSTGRSTGPHLHFEIRLPGLGALNPLQFLPAKA